VLCEYTVGYEEDYERFHEVRIGGELVNGGAGLACELNSPSTQDVKLTNCDADGLSDDFIRSRGGEEEACRADIKQNVVTEYGSVEYILRSDADGDGVFDRDDECPESAGELDSGCPNTPPSVSLDAPEVVEDEEEFEVSVQATDVEGHDLSYEWSNGDTGRTANYSFARSGQNVSVSVSVSDGFGTVSESATVEVLDSISDGDSSGSETGLLATILEWLSRLPGVSLG
jgi:hypothetical protein